MPFEENSHLSPEEQELTKQRMISDGQLLEGGADINSEGHLEATEEQQKAARIEMEREQGFFEAEKTVNNIRIVVEWDTGYNEYAFFLPDLDLHSARAQDEHLSDKLLIIPGLREGAEQVYKFAIETAEHVSDGYRLYNLVKDYINKNLRDSDFL